MLSSAIHGLLYISICLNFDMKSMFQYPITLQGVDYLLTAMCSTGGVGFLVNMCIYKIMLLPPRNSSLYVSTWSSFNIMLMADELIQVQDATSNLLFTQI